MCGAGKTSDIWVADIEVIRIDESTQPAVAFCQTHAPKQKIIELPINPGLEGSGLQWHFEPPLEVGDKLVCFLRKGQRKQLTPHPIFELELTSLWGQRAVRKRAGMPETANFQHLKELAGFVEDTTGESLTKHTNGIQNSNPMIIAWSADQLVASRHPEAGGAIKRLIDGKCSTSTRAASEFVLMSLEDEEWTKDPRREENFVRAAKAVASQRDVPRLAIFLSYQAQRGRLSWKVFSKTVRALAFNAPEEFREFEKHWIQIGRWYIVNAETEEQRSEIESQLKRWQ
ncbi:hypothetical protein CEE69_30855 [Rhodopirellula bahusiensis]|uniref:Uncharacterized protein n=2 Tax=Rhodopirellula bahusiensis TaxID=2014065 RepID=A0A2G1VXP3_9BACT|nr:hypothetical protein CEE69_30855 [Rhodopirellula bahusiensis]